ncbi:MAG: RND transporter [Sedimenticola sp.]|uniref:RND transporter n=1 Tax=Sedimenticola thiotaurini TaxID=1543721 RepID=A0A558DG09_9GAMM|nr:RND transporter [Sedimenticola sp.]TVT59970.1 MAG: RND transporter [Sedimenticola thiotaurini]MCW8921021.1 RND transporter [Sedimenticola sp.]MCW8947991.1 RND transporter [Sedimenticola sp.]MCW9021410.1 RND transporter [Sedimenticola sp.]
MAWLDEFSLVLIIAACLLLGLAPFTPEPHVWEKLKMLFDGRLVRPLDIFDLILHGTPFVILLMKLQRMRRLG